MSKLTRFLLVVFFLNPIFSAAQEGRRVNILEEMKRREQEIKMSESRKQWMKIEWRSTPATAVADASKANKPLLLVLVVGERGRPNAERC